MPRIRPLLTSDLPKVFDLSNRVFGENYFTMEELQSLEQQGHVGPLTANFVLEAEQGVEGVRLTLPPNGRWAHSKAQGLTVDRWPHPLDKTAYFQSLFLAPQWTGQGWGGQLSSKSLEVLKQVGALGVVCHSWKESPHQSSRKYLERLGFKLINEHPKYWADVDYNCTRCESQPCLCTAQEMYLELIQPGAVP